MLSKVNLEIHTRFSIPRDPPSNTPYHPTINFLSSPNKKPNIVSCMKVTEESFSFHHERKRTEEVRYQKY